MVTENEYVKILEQKWRESLPTRDAVTRTLYTWTRHRCPTTLLPTHIKLNHMVNKSYGNNMASSITYTTFSPSRLLMHQTSGKINKLMTTIFLLSYSSGIAHSVQTEWQLNFFTPSTLWMIASLPFHVMKDRFCCKTFEKFIVRNHTQIGLWFLNKLLGWGFLFLLFFLNFRPFEERNISQNTTSRNWYRLQQVPVVHFPCFWRMRLFSLHTVSKV